MKWPQVFRPRAAARLHRMGSQDLVSRAAKNSAAILRMLISSTSRMVSPQERKSNNSCRPKDWQLWRRRQERVERRSRGQVRFQPRYNPPHCFNNAVKTVARPRTGTIPQSHLVVKKGLKMRAQRCRVHPCPESSNHDPTYLHPRGMAWFSRARETETSWFRCSATSCGIASRAFPARLRPICCRLPSITFTHSSSDRAAGRGDVLTSTARRCHPYLQNSV